MNISMTQKKVQTLTKILESTKMELQHIQDQCDHVWGENRQVTIVNESYSLFKNNLYE